MAESQGFNRLHKGVQRWIWTQNWTSLRDIQEQATAGLADDLANQLGLDRRAQDVAGSAVRDVFDDHAPDTETPDDDIDLG